MRREDGLSERLSVHLVDVEDIGRLSQNREEPSQRTWKQLMGQVEQHQQMFDLDECLQISICPLVFNWPCRINQRINTVSVYLHHFLSQPGEEKASEELEGTTNTAEPDPAEIWKKDFQCQWYKTADGDVSDQLSPKDGAAASVGGEQVDALRSTTASSVASLTKAASVSGSPQPSLGAPTDGGPRQVGAPNLTALLLLTAVGLCGEP